MYLPPYVEKSFNSKVMKRFVPELRSRKCFSCFGIPMCVMNILCTFHVFIYGYVTKIQENFERLIFQDKLLVVHIPFIDMVKFRLLAQFIVDYRPHSVMSILILFLCKLTALAYYVIDRFVSIIT